MTALPARPDEITPAWLSEALAKSLPGVEVARVEVVDRHSGTTGRAKLRLDYASGARGPDTVFVKLPPFSEQQRALVAATIRRCESTKGGSFTNTVSGPRTSTPYSSRTRIRPGVPEC